MHGFKVVILDVDIDPPHYSATVGSTANFTCVSSMSSSTMTIQWQHNGVILANQTSPVLSMTNFKQKNSGTYHCIVTINNVTARSSSAYLSLHTASSLIDKLTCE